MENRDITEPGRDLPMLANINYQSQQQQQQHHIPDIEGKTSLAQNSRMNPMLLNKRDTLKGEEPISPQPGSLIPDLSTSTQKQTEDENMTEASRSEPEDHDMDDKSKDD